GMISRACQTACPPSTSTCRSGPYDIVLSAGQTRLAVPLADTGPRRVAGIRPRARDGSGVGGRAPLGGARRPLRRSGLAAAGGRAVGAPVHTPAAQQGPAARVEAPDPFLARKTR